MTNTHTARWSRPLKKIIAATAVAAAGLAFTGCSSDTAASEEFKLRVSNILTPNEIGSQGYDAFAEAVEEQSSGRIKVDVYHSSQLLETEELLPGLNDGRAEAGYLVADFYPEELPLWSSASLPFVTMDAAAQAQAYQELYEENDAFRAEFDDAGVHVLAFQPTMAGAIALSKDQSVESLEDFKGLRLRGFGHWASSVEAVGASPVFLTTSESLEGLERGVVDGLVGQSIDPMVDRGMIESAPNLLQTGMGMYVGTNLSISAEQWNALPDDLKTVLEDAASDLVDSMLQQYAERGDEYCQGVEAVGGKVTALSDEDQAEWESLVKDAEMQKWLENAVSAGVPEDEASSFLDAYTAKIDALEAESTFEDVLTSCVTS